MGRTAVPSALLPVKGLDAGVRRYVEALRGAGIETYESCQGGDGHTYPVPAVRFHGQRDEGFRALAVALQHGFPVRALHRCWHIQDGEPVGPDWELTFWKGATCPLRGDLRAGVLALMSVHPSMMGLRYEFGITSPNQHAKITGIVDRPVEYDLAVLEELYPDQAALLKEHLLVEEFFRS